MPRRETLMRIQRPIVVSDHQALREHIPEVNHAFPDIQLKWRRLGETGLTLLRRSEYRHAITKTGSILQAVGAAKVVETLNNQVIPRMPTEGQPLTATVTGVEHLGREPLISIALELDLHETSPERERLARVIDRMNGKITHFRRFLPHVTLASVAKDQFQPELLELFATFAPQSVRLQPAVALLLETKP